MRVNHIGVTVGDLDAAVAFHRDVFGLDVLVGPETAQVGAPGTRGRLDICGERWRDMRIAPLADENGTGVELFQFVEPPSRRTAVPPARRRTSCSPAGGSATARTRGATPSS